MTLHLIEKAIKPQFAWVDHPFRKLQTYDQRDKKRGLAVVIFIGIAQSFGIPDSDTSDYLCIEQSEYETKRREFEAYWSEILLRKEIGALCKRQDETDRVYLKTRLTLNALNTQNRGTTLHCALAI